MEYYPIIQRALSRETVKLLEHLLSIDMPVLERLERQKAEGNFRESKPLPLDKHQAYFETLKDDVDRFLGVTGITTPDLTQYNPVKKYVTAVAGIGAMVASVLLGINYDPLWFGGGMVGVVPLIATCQQFGAESSNKGEYKKGKIIINFLPAPREQILPIMGHEYVHHIQSEKGCPMFKTDEQQFDRMAHLEGHALGVQRYIAEKYRNEEDNSAFLYSTLDITVGRMKMLYTWLCKKLGETPRAGFQEDGLLPGLDAHALGLAHFLRQEISEGSQVYRMWLEKGMPVEQ